MCKKKLLMKIMVVGLCFNLMASSQVLAVSNSTISTKTTQVAKSYPARADIETLRNKTVTGTANISGWALNYSGIKKVDIYIDGTYYGAAKIGISRPDVDKVYPGYKGGKNCGFQYAANISKLANGNHTVKAVAIGNDGSSKSVSCTMNVMNKQNYPARADIETLRNKIVTRTANISGWALNYSGIKKVDIYIDGTYYGAAKIGISRPDVDKVYSGYKGGKNCGFQYTANISKLTNGNHEVKAVAIGNDSSSKIVTCTMNVMNNSTYYKNYNITLNEFVDKEYALEPVDYTDAGAWKRATKSQIAYYVNPNNFINNSDKYQFLKLTYTYGITAENLNSALTNRGVLRNHGSAFLTAGQKYNINPVYLIAHSILETGSGQSTLAKGVRVTKVDGKAVTPRVVYNVYGVGAYDNDAIRLGAEFAYKHGWFTVDQAIIGGAEFISSNYIRSSTNQQDTLYKMRWNPNNIYHQYATDIGWAKKQVTLLKSLMDKCPNAILTFEIPKFK